MERMERDNEITTMTRVLVVEDEHTIAESVELYLRREGYQTERAGDGQRALELWRAFQPDIILLDIGLPELDGLEVLQTIRAEDSVPVIMLTARAEEIDELLGLGMGADDYITKPFSLRVLVAHVKAVLKRHTREDRGTKPLRLGAIEIDTYRVSASANGKPLTLTPTEFKLLHHLAKTPGRAISRWELLEASMPESEALERAVDSHMKNLRYKLAEAGAEDAIETVWGVGYRMNETNGA
jgi:two-component system response regulator AdeR